MIIRETKILLSPSQNSQIILNIIYLCYKVGCPGKDVTARASVRHSAINREKGL